MDEQSVINKTITFVKSELANAEGGHDWWHIYRVWKSARNMAKIEGADLLVVELASLLHDIADSKFNGGDEEIGLQKARHFLEQEELSSDTIEHVVMIIEHISYKGGVTQNEIDSIEFKVTQDADRLDALGAIGIARAFNYGGFKNRGLYDPNIPPNLQMTKEEYKKSSAPTINHFYEKLLLLKDLMNTETGKMLAKKREDFMRSYLDQFYQEFEGKL